MIESNNGSKINVEETQLINVNIYDAHSSTILRVYPNTLAGEICRLISNKTDLNPDNLKFSNLILVITILDTIQNYNIHCVRTIQANEVILNVHQNLLTMLSKKYSNSEERDIKDAARWYFKDSRTVPIDFGDSGEVIGGYPSDDEGEVDISHSDLAYLGKSERKGYLLKRSSKDEHIWRRKYCVLTDHLWCVNINSIYGKESPKALCVRLTGISKEKKLPTSPLQAIKITSSKQVHYFRALNLQEQSRWFPQLIMKAEQSLDNELFYMAEAIISDEEATKSDRLFQVVNHALGFRSMFMSIVDNVQRVDHSNEAMIKTESAPNLINRTSFEDSNPNRSVEVQKRSTGLDSYEMIHENPDGFLSNVEEEEETNERESHWHDNKDDEGEDGEDQTTTPVLTSSGNHDLATLESLDLKSVRPDGSLDTSRTLPLPSTQDILYIDNNPLNRSLSASLHHRLYYRNPRVSDMLLFLTDVHRYKELYRQTIATAARQQQVAAILIYSGYILPQLQIADAKSSMRPDNPLNSFVLSNKSTHRKNGLQDCIPHSQSMNDIQNNNGTERKIRFKYYYKYIGSKYHMKRSHEVEKFQTTRSRLDLLRSSDDEFIEWGVQEDLLRSIHRYLFESPEMEVNMKSQDGEQDLDRVPPHRGTDETAPMSSIQNGFRTLPTTTSLIAPSSSSSSSSSSSISSSSSFWTWYAPSSASSTSGVDRDKSQYMVPNPPPHTTKEITPPPDEPTVAPNNNNNNNNNPKSYGYSSRNNSKSPPVNLFDDVIASLERLLLEYN